jgi:hypothetical protein
MVSAESKPFLKEIDSFDDKRLGLMEKNLARRVANVVNNIYGILFCVLDVPIEE